MSDSLRDKIAAVLANHLTDDYVAGKCDCGEKTDDGHSTHQADAVIREIGLREETCVMANHADHDKRVIYTKVPLHRYVTEWETEE